MAYSVLTEHSYSKPCVNSPRSSKSNSPRSSRNNSPRSSRSGSPRCASPRGVRCDTPSSSNPSYEDFEELSASGWKQSKLLRKERQRTFRLKQKVASLRKSMEKASKDFKSIADLIKGASHYLDEPALSFFASQLRNSSHRRRARGRRWSYDDKVIALSLYHQSPKAYAFCQRVFTLPSVSSLLRWLSNIEVRPGFSKTVFDLLKNKVACMSAKDKLCVVSFDEMSLRTGLTYNITEDVVEGFEDFGTLGRTDNPAKHALVFMVRGLTSKWKQPVGYFLAKDVTPGKKTGCALEGVHHSVEGHWPYSQSSCLRPGFK